MTTLAHHADSAIDAADLLYASYIRPALCEVLGPQIDKVIACLDVEVGARVPVRPDVADHLAIYIDDIDDDGFWATLSGPDIHVVIGGSKDPADYLYYLDQCDDLTPLDRCLAVMSKHAAAEGDGFSLFHPIA